MKPTITTDGYEIQRHVFTDTELEALRIEVDRVVKISGKSCVRHLRASSDVFDKLSVSEKLLSLIPKKMRPVRSILFDKTKSNNWPVLCHQDLTIAVSQEKEIPGYGPWSCKNQTPHVQPPISLLENMVTIRLHLDDTPATNGALRVIPKSHLMGRIPTENMDEYVNRTAVTCECSAGDVMLMSPLILHSSQRSEQPLRRRVLHFEYARHTDLNPSLEWYERGIF